MVDACMVRTMDENATNEADYLEFEREVDDPEQIRYIRWRTEQEEEKNQSFILQPVSGNGAGRKGKGKIKTCQGGKERATNMSALKLIARRGRRKGATRRMESQYNGEPDKKYHPAPKITQRGNKSSTRGDGKKAQTVPVRDRDVRRKDPRVRREKRRA